jgi:hypothetical protein
VCLIVHSFVKEASSSGNLSDINIVLPPYRTVYLYIYTFAHIYAHIYTFTHLHIYHISPAEMDEVAFSKGSSHHQHCIASPTSAKVEDGATEKDAAQYGRPFQRLPRTLRASPPSLSERRGLGTTCLRGRRERNAEESGIVRACTRKSLSLTLPLCVCARARARVCVCVCVPAERKAAAGIQFRI